MDWQPNNTANAVSGSRAVSPDPRSPIPPYHTDLSQPGAFAAWYRTQPKPGDDRPLWRRVLGYGAVVACAFGLMWGCGRIGR